MLSHLTLACVLYCPVADVAELADALDLGSSGATRAGSIPVIRISIHPSRSIARRLTTHKKTPDANASGVFVFVLNSSIMDNQR